MLVLLAAAAVSFSVVSRPAAVLPCYGCSFPVMQVDEANKPPPAMPENAAMWGCDEETWASIKNKRSLIKLCNDGEEEHFKKRLITLKALIANPTPKPEATPKAKAAKVGGRKKKGKTPLPLRKDGPYERSGGIPDAVDAAAITVQVNLRADAKVAKDYATADAIREALALQYVRIRDDTRTWSYKRPATSSPVSAVEPAE
mmetsp:Transcript_56534/g.129835  ORF Transcript_56534/g.129835 Transcript_56534/m.129835 type:complete len:201 (-) Transcript_56534:115-717(-)